MVHLPFNILLALGSWTLGVLDPGPQDESGNRSRPEPRIRVLGVARYSTWIHSVFVFGAPSHAARGSHQELGGDFAQAGRIRTVSIIAEHDAVAAGYRQARQAADICAAAADICAAADVRGQQDQGMRPARSIRT
ncbi:hypothetical protein CF326_g5953 [Tilletia indica]|nr:hypothetical protein CF326_g5953 [Tilletia indica]